MHGIKRAELSVEFGALLSLAGQLVRDSEAQAVVLLCHFHAFSSFVLGCGLMDNHLDDGEEQRSND